MEDVAEKVDDLKISADNAKASKKHKGKEETSTAPLEVSTVLAFYSIACFKVIQNNNYVIIIRWLAFIILKSIRIKIDYNRIVWCYQLCSQALYNACRYIYYVIFFDTLVRPSSRVLRSKD